ncbi:MAG TPA: BrnT family toxin [Thermoanaerobaculia bacterium]|nr:BrnT family toxin [Thermoanaerobaculia bacterium]
MEFRWNDWNVQHIAEHGVDPDDAEEAIETAGPSYPTAREDGKWLVWGRGRGGRLIQVVFVVDADDSIFVVHARELTEREKRGFRRHER